MGNSSSSGQGHWSDPSNVLRDAEKIRTRPMPQPKPQPPVDLPIDVDPTPTHVGVTTGSKQVPLGKGFYARADGPNGELGARKTPDGGFKVGAQANVGGVSVGHKNEHHDFSGGVSLGKGPGGVQVHGGEMPGMTISAGPVTASARHTALGKPVSPETAEMMKILGSH
jgi:hypothetical protein